MTDDSCHAAYRQAIEFLYGLRWFGAKFGLENTLKLAALAGNPHCKLRFIHIAGTNGKGSTCAFLEGIYRAAGLRVGLFTSPHLVSFRERVQVNRVLISEADVVRLVADLTPLLDQFSQGHHPTFFEVVTVMALRYFLEQNCDLVIWETGLGGRLDATNIVTPMASVITNVQYDHQQWLGDTLDRIAAEKAGIIKPGVPVITAAEAPEAIAVIEETARARGASVRRVGAVEALRISGVPLPGAHQRLNAALALATVNELQSQLPVSADAIRSGISGVNWPGRLQLIERPTGQKVLLDGAHNLPGAEALATALRELCPRSGFTLVLGVLRDKDWGGVCRTLAAQAGRILLVPVASERTASPEELAAACGEFNRTAEIRACPSLEAALSSAASDPFLVIAGSLYLVGEAMEFWGLSPAVSVDERPLNEWGGRAGEASRTS